MNEKYEEIVEILEIILEEDLQVKTRSEITSVLNFFKKEEEVNPTNLMGIQDDLEVISSSSKIDDYSRNEIINVVTLIESIYNS